MAFKFSSKVTNEALQLSFRVIRISSRAAVKAQLRPSHLSNQHYCDVRSLRRTIGRLRKASRVTRRTNDQTHNNDHIPSLHFNFDIAISKPPVAAPLSCRSGLDPVSPGLFLKDMTSLCCTVTCVLRASVKDMQHDRRWPSSDLCSGFSSWLCLCVILCWELVKPAH